MTTDHASLRPTQASRRSVFDMTPEELVELLGSWGEPTYRAGQLVEWVYQRNATSFDELTNLPKTLRGRLSDALSLHESTITRRRNAGDGVVKLLLRWCDGATSECVLIPDGARQTACISSQVGCPVGCVFCASGLGGLERNLSCGQIVEQAMRIRSLCDDGTRLSNVVFMGLGEPLANYDAVLRALRTINADWGMGIGARKITVSSVGLPKQIRKLADEQLQVTLALSLHAPTDKLRERIIPWTQRGNIASLIEAARYYFDRTGREVTLEYVLLGGLNDSATCAGQLADVVGRMRANVNLIPYNPVRGLPYERSTTDAAARFVDVLQERGVNVHVRRGRGLDIEAACGQLRRRGATGTPHQA